MTSPDSPAFDLGGGPPVPVEKRPRPNCAVCAEPLTTMPSDLGKPDSARVWAHAVMRRRDHAAVLPQ